MQALCNHNGSLNRDRFGSGLGLDWVWTGSGLGLDWVWTGSGLGLDWVRTGSGLLVGSVGNRNSLSSLIYFIVGF